jgi:hypothetical protein
VAAGVTERLLPVPTNVPPHEPVYHPKVVPVPPVYDSVLLVPLQTVVAVALTDVGAVGSGVTVTVTL